MPAVGQWGSRIDATVAGGAASMSGSQVTLRVGRAEHVGNHGLCGATVHTQGRSILGSVSSPRIIGYAIPHPMLVSHRIVVLVETWC